jgi:two-component system chemotaxis sensor kinase CheA
MTATVRVSTARLSAVLLQSEEMLSAKLAAGQRALDLRRANAAFGVWKKEWAKVQPFLQEIRPTTRTGANSGGIAGNGGNHRSLTKLIDFLEWNQSFVGSLEAAFAGEARSAERDGRALGSMVNNLLEETKKVLMLPFSSLLEVLPKVVRDLSRDSGKEVDLVIKGEEIEIDRRILEEMKDPLVHLVRNCIDHGIETPAERLEKGKAQHGTITVAVAPRDNKVELTVHDDGVGISLARVRAAVLKLGVLSREKAEDLTDRELLPYVFHSGVSTSPIITELSGRGLGLAIVREKVEKLGGTVFLQAAPLAGTTFRLVLPLTVATFRGITVRVGDRLFVLPTMHVERVVRLKRTELKTVENRETIQVNGEAVSLTHLADVLELTATPVTVESRELVQVVLLAAAGTRIAFLVDEIMGEQEVLLKNFGRQLSRAMWRAPRSSETARSHRF